MIALIPFIAGLVGFGCCVLIILILAVAVWRDRGTGWRT